MSCFAKSTNIALQYTKTRVFTYGAATDLNVLGTFDTTLESKSNITVSTVHVVKGSYGCLVYSIYSSIVGCLVYRILIVTEPRLLLA